MMISVIRLDNWEKTALFPLVFNLLEINEQSDRTDNGYQAISRWLLAEDSIVYV